MGSDGVNDILNISVSGSYGCAAIGRGKGRAAPGDDVGAAGGNAARLFRPYRAAAWPCIRPWASGCGKVLVAQVADVTRLIARTERTII